MKKIYRIMAHYLNGGLEAFGEMDSEELALKRIERLHESFVDADIHESLIPCEYEIRVIVKPD